MAGRATGLLLARRKEQNASDRIVRPIEDQLESAHRVVEAMGIKRRPQHISGVVIPVHFISVR